MLFNKKKKRSKKIPFDVLFVVAFMAFLVVGIINVLVIGSYRPLINFNSVIPEQGSGFEADETFYENKDPYITRNPNLADLLTGPIIDQDDPFLGNESAELSLVLFSDFSCDYCVKQEKVLQQILSEYNDRIKIIWKDYPENDEDSESFEASRASRCSAEQDQFWPYHDLLYEFNDQLNKKKYFEIADSLQLDKEKFQQCWDEKAVDEKIRSNIKEANALEITGIPFLYVGNQQVMGEIKYEELKRLVKLELSRQ